MGSEEGGEVVAFLFFVTACIIAWYVWEKYFKSTSTSEEEDSSSSSSDEMLYYYPPYDLIDYNSTFSLLSYGNGTYNISASNERNGPKSCANITTTTKYWQVDPYNTSTPNVVSSGTTYTGHHVILSLPFSVKIKYYTVGPNKSTNGKHNVVNEWLLDGSNDKSTWTFISKESINEGEFWTSYNSVTTREDLQKFEVSENTPSYQHYRFTIIQTFGGVTSSYPCACGFRLISTEYKGG